SFNAVTGQRGPFFSGTYMKYLATNGSNRLIVLRGGPDAELLVFELTAAGLNTTPLRTIGLTGVTPELGKNTVWLEGNTAYLALGQQGLAVVPDIETSTQQDVIYVTGTREEACNAVTADDEFIYLAYDQYVQFLAKADYTSYGILDFEDFVESEDEDRSINHVIAFDYD
ncbi:hypothetical protein RZS08_18140, partial [Arthrospira platensis SPKY1]|nr:hypothetical protein [Arthrospira platensis SPKY1]